VDSTLTASRLVPAALVAALIGGISVHARRAREPGASAETDCRRRAARRPLRQPNGVPHRASDRRHGDLRDRLP